MGAIEPDLVSDSIPKLTETYAGETEQERSARMQRYEKAKKAYQRAADTWQKRVETAFASYKRTLRTKTEAASVRHDRTHLQGLLPPSDA